MSLVGALALACPASALGPRVASAEEPALPACETSFVTLSDSVDSARATAGDAFHFAASVDIPASPEHPAVPLGTPGYGLVMGAHHSGRSGHAGHLDLELRFLELGDGTRVPVSLVPHPRDDAPVKDGLSVNAPGLLGMIPFGGAMVGAYNTIHMGREVVLAAGTRIPVLVGDALARGTCRLPVGGAKR